MIDDGTIEAIKQSIDLKEEIKPFLSDFKVLHDGRIQALCPFHKETNPSFFVHNDYFRCFGCKAKGDIYTWYKLYHKKEFLDAVRSLSEKSNIPIGFEDEERIKLIRKEIEDLQDTIDEFMLALWENEDALSYLINRGISNDTILKFSIGYDKKRNAITIPFYDASMRPINIVMRSLDDSARKYYYYKKGTPISHYFFNEQVMQSVDTLYITEGIFDCITLDQIGVSAIAYCSSSISEKQLLKLKKYSPRKLVFAPDTKNDNDIALGYNVATYLKNNLNIPIKIIFPNGDINQTQNLEEVLLNELSIEIAFLRHVLSGDIEEQRIKAKEYVSKIDDPLSRDDVIEEISKIWGKDKSLVENFFKIKNPNIRIISVPEALDLLEERLVRVSLGSCLNHKDFNPFFEPLGGGHVVGIGARTSVGKTNFILNLASRLEPPAEVIIMSLEQPVEEIMARLLCIKSGDFGGIDGTYINPKHLRGLVEAGDGRWDFLRRMTEELLPNIHIYDGVATISHIENVLRVAKDSYGNNLIAIIDYLGLVRTDKYVESEYTQVSQASMGIQKIAKELDVLCIASSQISRKGGSGNAPVSLDMFRGSGVIEETLDLAIGLWVEQEEDTHIADTLSLPIIPINIAVLKNRHGGVGAFNYVLDRRNLTFKRADSEELIGIY